MDNVNPGGTSSVRSVNRALDILLAFQEGDSELTASQLLARVSLSRPTLYRLLYTLQESGFVQASGEPQRFRLGTSVAQLARVWASCANGVLDIASAAQPMMRQLWTGTGETVALFTPDGTDRVCVAELASEQALSFRRGVGHRECILLGASGRVLLAHLPHTLSVLKAYARALPAHATAERGADTKLDLKSYAHELDLTAKRGYAVSRSELIQGAVAMAAPVFDGSSKVAGSLAVFGPSSRLDAARVKEVCQVLVAQARALSAALGHKNA